MTRLLVVHSDPHVARARAESLIGAGYTVETCPGPAQRPCPVLEDQACPLLDRADALIYDAGLGSPREMSFLVAHLRDTYVDLPLVLIGADDSAAWAPPDGPYRVWRVAPRASAGQVATVVEQALTEQGMAV